MGIELFERAEVADHKDWHAKARRDADAADLQCRRDALADEHGKKKSGAAGEIMLGKERPNRAATMIERLLHTAAHCESLYDMPEEAQVMRDGAAEIERMRARDAHHDQG